VEPGVLAGRGADVGVGVDPDDGEVVDVAAGQCREGGDADRALAAQGDDPGRVVLADDLEGAVRPFRGVEARGVAELVEGDVTSARVAIAGRYLGLGDGERFAAERRSRPGVLLRLVPDSPRVWDLSGSCLPDRPWKASTYRPSGRRLFDS
jgi:hypothetical protein